MHLSLAVLCRYQFWPVNANLAVRVYENLLLNDQRVLNEFQLSLYCTWGFDKGE